MKRQRISRLILTVFLIGVMATGFTIAGSAGIFPDAAKGVSGVWDMEAYAEGEEPDDYLTDNVDDPTLRSVIRILVNYSESHQGDSLYDYIHDEGFIEEQGASYKGDRITEYPAFQSMYNRGGVSENQVKNYSGEILLWAYTEITAKGLEDLSVVTNVSMVTLPNDLTAIPTSTFRQMANLNEVIIPDTVTEIGNSAFDQCTGLNYLLVSPGGSTGPSIDEPASSLIDLQKVTKVGNGAFRSCSSIETVRFGTSAQVAIASEAFASSGLHEVTVPRGTLGTGVFQNCTHLNNVVFDDSYTAIPQDTLSGAGTNGGGLSVELPSALTTIGAGAFEGSRISGMDLADCAGLKTIGGNAFKNAILTMTTLAPQDPETLYTFDLSACNQLSSIGREAFAGASFSAAEVSLMRITLPDSVSSMGERVFFGTRGFRSINIPESMTTIPDGTFMGCYDLETVSVPDICGVTEIGNHAFDLCGHLTGIDFINGMDNLTTIGDYAFARCVPDNTETDDEGLGLQSVSLPDGVTSVGASAFENDFRITSMKVGSGITEIPARFMACELVNAHLTWEPNVVMNGSGTANNTWSYTFAQLESSYNTFGKTPFTKLRNRYNYPAKPAALSQLIRVTFPNGLTTIGAGAFSGNSRLEASGTENNKLTVPASVTSLGASAFEGDSSLEEVTLPAGLTAIPEKCFKGCAAGTPGNYTGLRVISDLSNIETIGSEAFYNCRCLEKVRKNGSETALVFGSKLTSLGDKSFQGTNIGSAVSLKDTKISSIGVYTFYDCASLRYVTCPDTLESIGSYAFAKCPLLERIIFPVQARLDLNMIQNNEQPIELQASQGGLSDVYMVPIGRTTSFPAQAFKDADQNTAEIYQKMVDGQAAGSFVNQADIESDSDKYFAVDFDSAKKEYRITGGEKEVADTALRISASVPFKGRTAQKISITFPVEVTSTHADEATMAFDDAKFKLGTAAIKPVTTEDGQKILYINKKDIGKQLTLALNTQSTDKDYPAIVTDKAVWTPDPANVIRLVEVKDSAFSADYTTTMAVFEIRNTGSATVRAAFDDSGTADDPSKQILIEVVEPISAIDYTLGSVGDKKSNPTKLEMRLGAKDSILAVPEYSVAGDMRDEITFTSDKSGIVNVGQDGKIEAKGIGTAVVTIGTLSGNISKKITIVVKGADAVVTPQYIEINGPMTDDSKGLVYCGETSTFTATVLPEYATQEVVWSITPQTEASKVNLTPVDGGRSARVTGGDTPTERAKLKVTGKNGAPAPNPTVLAVRSKTDTIEFRENPPVIGVGDTKSFNLTNTQTQTNGIVRVPQGTSWPVTFTSSDPSVLTLGKSKTACDETSVTLSSNTALHYKGVKVGTATITASMENGQKDTLLVTVINDPITALKCTNGSLSMVEGSVASMELTRSPEDSQETINYASDNTGVATVTAEGKIRAVGTGTTRVTAVSAVNKVKTTCNVTVYGKASTLQFKGGPLQVKTGAKSTLKLSNDTGQTKGIVRTPADSGESVTFTVSDPSVFTIGKSSSACSSKTVTLTGKTATLYYMALKQGETTLTARSESGLTTTMKVGVYDPLSKLTCENSPLTIMEGKQSKMQLTRLPSSNREPITYTSSNASVIKVDANGNMKAVGAGTARVTATSAVSKKTATCSVTVYMKATNLEFREEPIVMAKGDDGNMRLTSSLKQIDGIVRTPTDSWEKVTFTSSNPSVLLLGSSKASCRATSLTLTGKTATLYYAAQAQGSATITAVSESGLRCTLQVTVVDPITELTAARKTKTMFKGRKYKLKLKKTPASSKEPVTFTSSNTAVATVNKNGRIKAVSPGTATITARSTIRKVSATCRITVLGPGQKVNVKGVSYKVNSSGTLTFAGTTAAAKKLVIPATVKLDGTTFKVSAIGPKACAGKIGIISVTIGKNIKTIGKNAFSGCSSLKNVKIKSKKIKTIKKDAFKTIKEGATIKCPSGKRAKYLKLLKKSGLPLKAKVK